MIEIKNLTKKINKRIILSDLSISLPDQGIVLIKGENGSGKTTFLNLISLNDNEFEGEIVLGGLDVKKLGNIERQKIKNKYITYVTQKHNLITFLSEEENEHLDDLKYYSHNDRNKNIINNLSEGEQMLCTLKRATKSGKKLYIFDEVFSSLDSKNQNYYINKIKELAKNSLVIIVSHFLNNIDGIDFIFELRNSKISVIKNESTKNSIEKNTQLFNIDNVKSKFSFKLFLRSFFSNKVLKITFLFLSFICLSFSVGGTGLALLRPGVAITNEVKSLPALIFSNETDNNVNLIEDAFKDDITYYKKGYYVYTDEVYHLKIDFIFIDEKINDDKIHLNQEFYNLLRKKYTSINSLSDLKVNSDYDKINYDFVIDNNVSGCNFWITDNGAKKTNFYLWLNDDNRQFVFEYINKFYIQLCSPNNEILLGYDEFSEKAQRINESIYAANKIIEGHFELGRKNWIIVLSILSIATFTIISVIMLISIRNSQMRNIKILEKEGFQRYEINTLIYVPYLLILTFNLLLGKILSFYLFPTKDSFGIMIGIIPENLIFYLFILFGVWTLSYMFSRRSQKWDIYR